MYCYLVLVAGQQVICFKVQWKNRSTHWLMLMDPKGLNKISPDRSVVTFSLSKGFLKVSQTKECQLLLAPHDVINNGPRARKHAHAHTPQLISSHLVHMTRCRHDHHGRDLPSTYEW
jgi:hypothetical protein